MRDGCSRASHNPLPGSRSSFRATVPKCRSRSTRAIRSRRSAASNQAQATADVVAPTPPRLAERRAAAISSELLRYGIVASRQILDTVPANRAIVSVGRYTVTLPACPNWSESLDYDFTNARSSYFGCANATNLGLMVASPADLVSGRTLGPADAQPAVAAVERYMNDRVKQPPAPTASPFAASTGGGGGGDTGGAGGGAPGAGVGAGAQ